jgi:hypothetical protein
MTCAIKYYRNSRHRAVAVLAAASKHEQAGCNRRDSHCATLLQQLAEDYFG